MAAKRGGQMRLAGEAAAERDVREAVVAAARGLPVDRRRARPTATLPSRSATPGASGPRDAIPIAPLAQ